MTVFYNLYSDPNLYGLTVPTSDISKTYGLMGNIPGYNVPVHLGQQALWTNVPRFVPPVWSSLPVSPVVDPTLHARTFNPVMDPTLYARSFIPTGTIPFGSHLGYGYAGLPINPLQRPLGFC
ncbi:MAG: hypothetical protein D6738_09380 [Acidobacteria bacterium]|nr:MAG: hypothetical protein D6738_09380 [Acidobacteriota bacterium]